MGMMASWNRRRTPMTLFLFILHLLILGALALMALNFFLNLPVVRRLRPVRHAEGAPLVSILVPARNEEVSIGRCLRSLQEQDYPNFEIILLDDQSTDRTGELARSLGFAESHLRFRLMEGKPLPSGWVGKPWACHQLSEAARGEYFLFTDADTDHSPQALGAAMAEVLASRADLLSVWPRQETGTWSEKWVVSILFMAGGTMVPHWWLWLGQRFSRIGKGLRPEQWRTLGIANGQYLIFPRQSYLRLGGHRALCDQLVEDVCFGRLVASRTPEGMILRNVDGTQVVSTRMYRNFREVWEGFSKNAWPVFEGSLARFSFWVSVQWLVMVGPFALLLAPGSLRWMAVGEIALIVVLRTLVSVHYRSSGSGALAHPLAYTLATAIAWNSYRLGRKKGVLWKGRTYEVQGGAGRVGN